MLECSQLLEAFDDFQRSPFQLRKSPEKSCAVNIKTDVERIGPTRGNRNTRKIQRHAVPSGDDFDAIRIPAVFGTEGSAERNDFGVADRGGLYGSIDDFGFDKRFVALHIDDQGVRVKAVRGLGETVSSTLVVIPGHYGVAAESPHGFGNPRIVCGDKDFFD